MKQTPPILRLTLLIWIFVLCEKRASAELAASINYASSYLGAKITEHSDGMEGTHHLLRDDSAYLIVPCNLPRKRFTIQLSRDLIVRTVSITSLEYFSSIVETFVILGSERFPCTPPSCMWSVLGRFRANFTRSAQHFEVGTDARPGPTIRFLRFIWSSHYGHEKSCTLTTLHVYGQDRFELVNLNPGPPEEIDLPSRSDSVTEFGPYMYSTWWTEPRDLNVSRCPNNIVTQHVEEFLWKTRFDTELTCTWNVTRPAAQVPDLISSRQLAWLKNNITAIRVAVARAATAQQLFELRDNVTQLVSFVNSQIDALGLLSERLDALENTLIQVAVAVCTAVVSIVLIGVGLAASKRNLRSGDSFFLPRSPRNRQSHDPLLSRSPEESTDMLVLDSTQVFGETVQEES